MKIAIIGAGVIGLATTRALSQAGHQVDCYDSSPGLGASTGRGRIFRVAHQSPELVDLALQARTQWSSWERACDKVLIEPSGFLLSSQAIVPAYIAAMQEAGASYQEKSIQQTRDLLPWMHFEEPCLWDPQGGAAEASIVMAWLLEQCAESLICEAVTQIQDEASQTIINGRTYDRALICAGSATSTLAAKVGISLPDHHSRHARLSFNVAPAQRYPAFMDRQVASPAHGAYGVSMSLGTYAVGVAWSDNTCKSDWTLEQTLAYHATANDQYRKRWFPSLKANGEYVTCQNNHWPFAKGRQFSLWQSNGSVLAFGGNDLFKFAPLLGANLAAIIQGANVPAHLTAVNEWPDVHPVQGGKVVLTPITL